MTIWDRLLASLDATLGFSERFSTKVMKLRQGFDNKTQEHVILVEYRVKIRIGTPAKPELDFAKFSQDRQMVLLKDLLAHHDDF